MSIKEFSDSIKYPEPPDGLSPLLQALWYDRKGNWHTSHSIAQETETHEGSWVHAYLHRKEGDDSNASYWYHKAGKSFPTVPLEQEWLQIVTSLI